MKNRQTKYESSTGITSPAWPLAKAAAEAGIETCHGTVKRLMKNRHCLGSDLYPANINQETDIAEFDETLVRRLIENITVFQDHFTSESKSGLTIDISEQIRKTPHYG